MILDLPKKLVKTRKRRAEPTSSTESSKALPLRFKLISNRNCAGKLPVENDNRRHATSLSHSSDSAREGSEQEAGPVGGHRCAQKPKAISTSIKQVNDEIPKITDAPRRDNTLHDLISSKLDTIITLIDGEEFDGDEGELGKAVDDIWSNYYY